MDIRIIKNYIYNLSYQILLMILPIITTPYISRVLSPEDIGKYNYTFSIVSILIIISQLGTNMYGQREIAYVQNNIIERSKIFWEILIIRSIMTISILPIYVIISTSLRNYTELLLWMTIYLIANLVDFSWLFQGLEEFKKITIRSIVVKIIGVILIFTFVKKTEDLIIYTIILSVSQFLGNLILLFYVPQKIKLIPLRKISIKKHIKSILILFLPTSAIYVYTSVDKILLGSLSTNNQLGFYSQAEKIIKLLMTIITSLGIVLLPHIATIVKQQNYKEIKEKISQAVYFVMWLGCPMVIGTIVIANRFVIWFLGNDYFEAILLFKVLSPLIIIIGIASIVGQAILIPLKKQKIYTISIFTGAILNVICNILLIPKLDALGAAIGTVIAELSVTAIQAIAIDKYIKINIFEIIKRSWKYIWSSLLMGIVLLVLDKYLPNDEKYILIMIIIGVSIYLVNLFILKDILMKKFLNNRLLYSFKKKY